MYKNDLIRKIRLILKFVTSQPLETNNCNNMSQNISKSKDNQTMKFGQLIEYNIRKIFLILFSNNGPNLIAWLLFFREILGNMCIVIVC